MKKKEVREIVKEQSESGEIVYRYSDFNKDIDESMIDEGELNWRFHIIMSRFKEFLDLLGDSDEAARLGVVLSPIINAAAEELDDISDLIEEAVGDIRVIYDTDTRYANFRHESVAGLVVRPSGKGLQKAEEGGQS